MKTGLTILALIAGLLGSTVLLVPDAKAGIAGFKAGRIIDDTVMADAGSMSVNDIQNFLNSKVPNCDTNGSGQSEMNNSGVPDYNGNGSIQRWEWGKKKYNQTTFTCLKNYSQSGKSAAKIIYDAAQEFTISPRVLIVLLQKEQGLVTDTWPINTQYRSATGYGCPDTAACDADYYGFTNQVRWSARMFRAILNDSPSWYTPYELGSNQIRWNPNTACGHSTVNIENRATQALYNYTPYRPNQAALDAGYGSGNSCSSYGNRNFYLYFTDWFGSTSAPLFLIEGGGSTLYLSFGDTYYTIPSLDVYRAYGLNGMRIVTVKSSQLSSYTKGPDLSVIAAFGASSTAYFIDNGKYYPIPSMGMLNQYGYVGSDIKVFSDANLLNLLSPGKTVTTLAHMSDGAIYYVDDAKKHVFPDYNTFITLGPGLTGDSSLKFNSFSDSLMGNVADGTPVLRDGSIIKSKSSDTIYLFNNSELLPFTYDAWVAWGNLLDYSFSSASMSDMAVSTTDVPVLTSDGTNKYLIDSGKKYKFSTNIQSQWNLDNDQFTALSTNSLARLNNGADVGILIGSKSGAVYVVHDNEKLAIPAATDFVNLGYRWNQVLRLDSSSLALVPTGTTLVFSPGSLVLLPSGAVVWIDANYMSHTIPSLEIFDAYGFKWTDVRKFDTQSLSGYTDDTLQRLSISGSGNHYLADLGKRIGISPTAYGSGQYNLSGVSKTPLSDKLFASLNAGPSLTNFIRGSGATVYMVEDGQKHPISSPASLFAHGGSWSKVTRVSDGFLSTISTGSTY